MILLRPRRYLREPNIPPALAFAGAGEQRHLQKPPKHLGRYDVKGAASRARQEYPTATRRDGRTRARPLLLPPAGAKGCSGRPSSRAHALDGEDRPAASGSGDVVGPSHIRRTKHNKHALFITTDGRPQSPTVPLRATYSSLLASTIPNSTTVSSPPFLYLQLFCPSLDDPHQLAVERKTLSANTNGLIDARRYQAPPSRIPSLGPGITTTTQNLSSRCLDGGYLAVEEEAKRRKKSMSRCRADYPQNRREVLSPTVCCIHVIDKAACRATRLGEWLSGTAPPQFSATPRSPRRLISTDPNLGRPNS